MNYEPERRRPLVETISALFESFASALIDNQWITSWASLAVSFLTIFLAFIEPDRKRKRILRDIQIYREWGEHGDCRSLWLLQDEVNRNIESTYGKAKSMPYPNWVLALYFAVYIPWTILLFHLSLYFAVVINILTVAVATTCVVIVRTLARKREKALEKEIKLRQKETGEKAAPVIEYLANGFSYGLSEEQVMRFFFPKRKAARFYANLLADDIVERRYLDEAFTEAARRSVETTGDEDLGRKIEENLDADAAAGFLRETEEAFMRKSDALLAELSSLINDASKVASCKRLDKARRDSLKRVACVSRDMENLYLRYGIYIDRSAAEAFRQIALKAQDCVEVYTSLATLVAYQQSVSQEERRLAENLRDATLKMIVDYRLSRKARLSTLKRGTARLVAEASRQAAEESD